MGKPRLRLLGSPILTDTSGTPVTITSRKAMAVLCYLAASNQESVPRSKLAGLLWPDVTDEQARTSLRQTLSVLRRQFQETGDLIRSSGTDGLSIASEQLDTDISLFEQCIVKGGKDDLRQAVEIYQGPFIDGLSVRSDMFEQWQEDQRKRFEDIAVKAIGQLIKLCLDGEENAQALALAGRSIKMDPLNEEMHRTVMLINQRIGRLNDALKQYRNCEAILRDELGVEPEEETRLLFEKIEQFREHSRPRMQSLLTATVDPVPPLKEGKPILAVLPFQDLNNANGQDYFSDGLTEDIITEVSRFPGLSVIARNSSFASKDTGHSLDEIAVDLGMHYIVKGSVRRSGNRVRVTAQLLEAPDGKSIWADRFDKELEDIFDLQDELTSGIAAVLASRIENFEARKIARKVPDDMAAYELLLAAKIHHHRFTKQDNQVAFEFLERAIEIDPEYAAAYAWKACLLGQAIGRGYLPNPNALVEQAIEAVDKALLLDPNEVECHRILAEIRMENHRLDLAERHNERALWLNPNDPRILAQKGELLAWLGNAYGAVGWIEAAMRLDPFSSPAWAHLLGWTLMLSERYEDAVSAYSASNYPKFAHHADMAGCFAKLGSFDLSDLHVAEVLKRNPRFSIADHSMSWPYQNGKDRDKHKALLELAKLPS
jgi:TolB-like protein/Tfp pilus assembly protein PilF